MKTSYIVAVVIVLVLVGGFLGRHKIKALMSGAPAPTPTQTESMTVSPSPSPTNASSSATQANSILMTKSGTKGDYLTDPKGMTLYMFDKDKPGVSNCNTSCLKIWPAYSPAKGTSNSLPTNVTIITNTAGNAQYAYKDMPLYYYSSDKKVGDTLGDGVGAVWHFVKP